MKKAIFLDRDGVINDNSEYYYIFRSDQLTYNPDILSIIKQFNEAGFIVIVISNQGGVSKGLYTPSDVDQLHKKIRNDVDKSGGSIIDFFYCPHHNKVENCLCRKPSPLLIERAAAQYDIDLASSYMIGDSDRDVEAGQKAGLKASFKVTSNESSRRVLDKILNE